MLIFSLPMVLQNINIFEILIVYWIPQWRKERRMSIKRRKVGNYELSIAIHETRPALQAFVIRKQ